MGLNPIYNQFAKLTEMAENTDIDIIEIENKLLNLINQFGIKIEESHTGTWTNNPDILRFSFWHDKSADILKQLKFQFVIRKLSQDNIFKFNKKYCLAFDVMTSKTKQFRDYLGIFRKYLSNCLTIL